MFAGCQAGYYESQIIKDLFTSNYSTESRPVANESAPITVFFEIVYSQTVDLVRLRSAFIYLL